MATIKQKKAAQKVFVEGKSISKAMKEVGYSDQTAKNPKNLTESKGWKELLEFYFPDEFLLEEHKKNIKQDKDKGAKNKAIDMAYKLKDKYPKEQGEIDAGDFKIVISKK